MLTMFKFIILFGNFLKPIQTLLRLIKTHPDAVETRSDSNSFRRFRLRLNLDLLTHLN